MSVKIISARVAQKNTRLSDSMPEVMHTVFGIKNGVPVTAQLMASDPLDAIKRADSLSDTSWAEGQ